MNSTHFKEEFVNTLKIREEKSSDEDHDVAGETDLKKTGGTDLGSDERGRLERCSEPYKVRKS